MLNEETLTKICRKCNEEKELEEFNNHIRKKFGKANICKICKRIEDKKSYQNNRQKRLEYARKYRKENKMKIKKEKPYAFHTPDGPKRYGEDIYWAWKDVILLRFVYKGKLEIK